MNAKIPGPGGGGNAAASFQPLYRQLRGIFVRRLGDGTWRAGAPLPSEFELARELGVSQGTVRKTLDALAADRLVVRRQGRGTFAAEHDEQRILFQFFKLQPDRGKRAFPESRVLRVSEGAATAAERRRLGLPQGAQVLRIRRLRMIGGAPVIAETVTVPAGLFPGLARGGVPNNLYGLYAETFGVTVAGASEKLKAVALSAADAALLGAPPGTPALRIDRLALALDGRAAEWRVSLCLTEKFHYLSELK